MIYFGNTQPNPLEAKVWLQANGQLKTYNGHTKQWGGPSATPPTDDEQPNGPNLITFTVDGKEYQAEEGMTWLAFVYSTYNVDSFRIHNVHDAILVHSEGQGSAQNNYLVAEEDGSLSEPTNKIINGYAYDIIPF